MSKTPVALLLASSLFSASCATLGTTLDTVETVAAQTFITSDQENALGLQVKQQLESDQKVRYLNDPVVVDYVRGVANRILTFAKAERGDVNWTVNVIDDPATINAFATPGGYLYVYTGLLMLADNEAELAAVMGHESGHVVARHSARQMVDAYGIQAVTSLALGQNPNLLAQLGTTIASKGAMLAHSRAIEDQADEFGVRYASKAGYDPKALATFFGKLKAKVGDTSGIATWLSDHPATGDRIAHIGNLVQQGSLGGTDLGASRFAPIKARLAGRPAPSTTPTPPTPSTPPPVAPTPPPAAPRKAPPA